MRVFLIGLVIFLSGCATQQGVNGNMRLAAMGVGDFYDRVTIVDDALETSAQIHTQDAYTEKQGLLGIEWGDQFLRAFVDKETGLTLYQVYDRVYMKKWSLFYAAHYETDAGVETVEVKRVASDVRSCSSNAFIGCDLREDVVWAVDRETLEKVAATYNPGGNSIWQYKLKAQQGEDVLRAFTAAEVSAFILVVDDYKDRHNLP